MGLLNGILDTDLDNCKYLLTNDTVLVNYMGKIEKMLDDMENADGLALEELINGYTARLIRVCYFTGLKDFNDLFVELNADSKTLLDTYTDIRYE